MAGKNSTAPSQTHLQPEISESSGRNYLPLVAGILLLLLATLLGATLYAIGQSGERFRWDTFRNGGSLFVLILAGTVVVGFVFTVVFRLVATLSPQSLKMMKERRQLNSARKKVLSTIDRRHQMQEEQARLTAMMQASYLYERESARISNSQALREFQTALQSGLVRSCEIVFDHLNRTVEHYEQVVSEIDQSSLDASDKTELLNSLSRALDTGPLAQRQRSAQRMMEDAIWGVRLRKARLMARRSPDAARKYLQSVRQPDTSHRILIQVEALLKELS